MLNGANLQAYVLGVVAINAGIMDALVFLNNQQNYNKPSVKKHNGKPRTKV